jgi:hypothetical protein
MDFGGAFKNGSSFKNRQLLAWRLLRELVPKAIPIGVDNGWSRIGFGRGECDRPSAIIR